ncbi:MAG: hypothetical protein NTW62_00480 [Candidatus Nomurabacteria bacterium]|nr:hypothetical protein [Candidatus Nomurabacteria bacterium]
MISKKPEKNEFFDINKLPAEKGLLLFGLSMNKLTNGLNASHCLKYIQQISPSKVSKPLIGLNFIYGDFLYLLSSEKSYILKHKFMNEITHHKNSMQKLIHKHHLEFQIQNAFEYMTWNQLYLSMSDFPEKFSQLKNIYKKDKLFQKYLKEDCKAFNKKISENQINFFLEEHLMFYFLSKGKAYLPNEYIEHREKWILFCYPGNPLKAQIYLHQLNPFKLNWVENPYQNSQYNLESKKLINFENVDLETYSVK